MFYRKNKDLAIIFLRNGLGNDGISKINLPDLQNCSQSKTAGAAQMPKVPISRYDVLHADSALFSTLVPRL